VVPSGVEELSGGSDPAFVAVENARRKALAVLRASVGVSRRLPPETPTSTTGPARSGAGAQGVAATTVLGVDTIVVLDGGIYGKPGSEPDARAMLGALSGRVHEVVSGLCVAEGEAMRTACATTRVRFRSLSPSLLDWYLATGEWRERAGGYAIQGRGAALVAAIEGDYLNVVGLPVSVLLELLPALLHEPS
jgi:septum formation protein